MRKSTLIRLGQNDTFKAIQDGREYRVVAREGEMTEVYDIKNSRYFAWPNSALVYPTQNAKPKSWPVTA